MRVRLVFEGCAEVSELVMILLFIEQETNVHNECPQTRALFSPDLVVELSDVMENLDDLSLGLVDQQLD